MNKNNTSFNNVFDALKYFIIDYFNTKDGIINYRNKELNDIVTDDDIKIEEGCLRIIHSMYPHHRVLSEELPDTKTSIKTIYNLVDKNKDMYVWIIDPIDGTINYSRGFGLYAVSIALVKLSINNNKNIKQEVIQSLVYLPKMGMGNKGEIYEAKINEGSYLVNLSDNTRTRLKVSDTTEINKAFISLIATSHYKRDETELVSQVFTQLNTRVRGVRMISCIAVDLCYIARGIFDGALVVLKQDMFGTAAGLLILKEAGGRVFDRNGRDINIFDSDKLRPEMLASNDKIDINNLLLEAINI